NLRARPVPHESCLTAIRSSYQESGHRIHSILQALSPLKDPVERRGHIVRKGALDTRVNVDEVDRTGTGGRQDSKVVALGKERIKCSKRFRVWVVTARDVCLRAEAWFQSHGRKPVAGF